MFRLAMNSSFSLFSRVSLTALIVLLALKHWETLITRTALKMATFQTDQHRHNMATGCTRGWPSEARAPKRKRRWVKHLCLDFIVRFFDIVFNVTSKGMLNAVVFGFVLCFNLNLHPHRQQNKMFQTKKHTVPKL